MKFALSAATLAFAARALADDTFKLFVQSDNSELSGQGISSKHEGAGIDYYFLGSGSSDFSLSGTTLTESGNTLPQVFSVAPGFVALTVADSGASVSLSDAGVLEVDGSEEGFYACKNTNDPYKYSEYQYELIYGQEIGTCVAIKLAKSGFSSSATSSSATVSSSAVKSSSAVITPTINSTVNTVTESNTETETVSCHKCSISTYEGAAQIAKPIGFAAVIAGFAAVLI